MRPPTGGAESCTLSFVAFLALFFRIYDPRLTAASGPGIPACHVTPTAALLRAKIIMPETLLAGCI